MLPWLLGELWHRLPHALPQKDCLTLPCGRQAEVPLLHPAEQTVPRVVSDGEMSECLVEFSKTSW